MSASGLAARQYVVDAIARAWAGLGAAGTWWTGPERVEIARIARAAMGGNSDVESSVLDPAIGEAATMVATRAFDIERGDVDRWTASAMSHEYYVELVGVVSRLASIDTTMRGLGAPRLDLPAGRRGSPSRQRNADAKLRSAFVPMVGAAGATTALTSVESEAAAQRDIHILYLSYEQMGDLDIEVDLHRTQLELVAARTSLLNHCEY